VEAASLLAQKLRELARAPTDQLVDAPKQKTVAWIETHGFIDSTHLRFRTQIGVFTRLSVS
jgi:hypothetical protein